METKYAKHDQLVNQNQLVKYKQPAIEPKIESEKEKIENPVQRSCIKKMNPRREDGGQVKETKTTLLMI